MAELQNPARDRLQAGELALGIGLRHTRNVEIAKACKAVGFDWLFIDLEHSSMSIDTAQQISVTALDVGITPIVRVPEGEDALAVRLLTGGAMGTVMPHVDTADQARAIVDAQRFPPVGRRGSGGVTAHFDFQRVPHAEAARLMNERALLVVMLESQEAIANADEIAAVDGVDVLMIGTGDLTAELGIHGKPDHPDVAAAHEAVAAACKRHGKWSGTGGIGPGEVLARYIGMGVRFVLAGGDLGFMMQAAAARAEFFRGLDLGQG